MKCKKLANGLLDAATEVVVVTRKPRDKKTSKSEIIKPKEIQKNHPHGQIVSLLDIDTKEDLRGQFNLRRLLDLGKLIYGDLKNDLKSREKLSNHLRNSLELFKKSSDGYFEQKKEFITFEKQFRKSFINKTPSYEKDILPLFFAKGKSKNTEFSRAMLMGTLPSVHIEDNEEDYSNLDEVQSNLLKHMNELVTEKGFFKGVHSAEVVQIKENPKRLIRLHQKFITKIGMEKKDVPDATRLRFILRVNVGPEESKEKILNEVAKRVQKKLKIRKIGGSFKLEDPGDDTRTELKVEGVLEGKTSEISIFDETEHERDEVYGPYNHKIYEFIKGDSYHLARVGMLERGYIQKRINELNGLETWSNIPSDAYKKILKDFRGVIKRKKGIETKTETVQNDKGKNTIKTYSISKPTARAIIRERIRREGFRLNKDDDRYYRNQDVARKAPFIEDPEKVLEIQRLTQEMIGAVWNSGITHNKNDIRIKINKNTAWNILKGDYSFVNKKVIEVLNKKMKLNLKKKES